jgi:hypothetical protein
MKIDRVVERAVREALAGAVSQEPERFEAALDAIANGGESFTYTAVKLAIAVDGAALFSLHEGVGPDEDQARELAQEFVESEEWSQIKLPVAEPFLVSLAGGESESARLLGLGDIAQTSFAVGGWLLSAFLPEGKDWTDMLDDLLEQIEATPEIQL